MTKADHVIFCTDVEAKPTDLKGRPLMQKTFIIQLGKQNLINTDKLGFKEEFKDVFDKIEAIYSGQWRHVSYENDPTLAKYISKEKFNALKEQIESSRKITFTNTKEFFEVEACLTAMSYCLKQLQEIYKQKEYQIFCEVIHVEYNK